MRASRFPKTLQKCCHLLTSLAYTQAAVRPDWYIILLGISLQWLLLWRGFRCGLWGRYPLFYVYLTYAAAWSAVIALPAMMRHPAYSEVYWLSQLGSSLLRFGVAAEVYRHVFPHDSSPRRTAGKALVAALTLLAALFWASGASPGPSIIFDFLRKVALSQAVWVLLILGLAQYYGIRIGRNIWGMAAGLLIFVGIDMLNRAASDLFLLTLRLVSPLAYVSALVIWTFALWNYSPNPQIARVDRSVYIELLSAWKDRWEAIADTVRKVAKP